MTIIVKVLVVALITRVFRIFTIPHWVKLRGIIPKIHKFKILLKLKRKDIRRLMSNINRHHQIINPKVKRIIMMMKTMMIMLIIIKRKETTVKQHQVSVTVIMTIVTIINFAPLAISTPVIIIIIIIKQIHLHLKILISPKTVVIRIVLKIITKAMMT